MRVLIVNADDFGRSSGINRGVIRAHEEGIVTSASLMVRHAGAEEAARYALKQSDLGVGLHVEVAEWAYRDGAWTPDSVVVDESDRREVAAEIERQLERFRELMGADPTHLDSHQHVHLREPVRTTMRHLSARLGKPLRSLDPTVRYCGTFYGQTGRGEPLPDAISVESLLEVLAGLPHGVTELGCHPGEIGDFESSYLEERPREIETLTDPRVRRLLEREGIRLRSFRDALA